MKLLRKPVWQVAFVGAILVGALACENLDARGRGGGGLRVQAAHVARPGLVPQHHRRRGEGFGLELQAAQVARPDLLL